MLSKSLAVVLLVFALMSTPTVQAQSDYRTEAQNMINTLNPVNQALGPLIDQANNDMRDRLEQLRGIIGEALTNLHAILKDTTIRVNADGEARLNQLNSHLRDNLDLLNNIASGRIKSIDAAAQARIDQLEIAADQFAESLPIDMQPLPKATLRGFALVKPTNKDYALLYISGAGLRKGGTEPRAYFFQGDSSDRHLVGHNGTSLTVLASSMGLIQIKIPNSLFPDHGQADKSIMLTLAKNNHFPGSVEQSFPLLLCSSVPTYTASVDVEASGFSWETRAVDYPRYTQPEIKQYRIEDGGSNSHYDVCASDADSDGWEADPTVNEKVTNARGSNTLFGLHYDGALEHVGNLLTNYPKNGCLRLYAARDSSGGGFSQAYGITVHQRKRVAGSCGFGKVSSRALHLGQNSIDAKPDAFEAACITAQDGAPSSAKIRIHLWIKDHSSYQIEDQDLSVSTSTGQSFFNGAITASLNENGLINLNVSASCRQDDINYASQ